ncbi:hypothetical protein RIF29_04900 [Crotalaria pallida]|uniref:Uncharacterized protein n=1 Tax=Crotalaria pallida TaxID=3830 RepID=A0AAN9J295_CROPI
MNLDIAKDEEKLLEKLLPAMEKTHGEEDSRRRRRRSCYRRWRRRTGKKTHGGGEAYGASETSADFYFVALFKFVLCIYFVSCIRPVFADESKKPTPRIMS